MAVIQPLYFAGGRYSANVDRKLLASLVKPAADGTRLEGVIPANQGTNSMKVSPSSGMTLAISSGLAVIADSSTQDVDNPGVYLAGVDTSAETVTIASNTTGATRYDLVYAEVSETSFSISSRDYSGSTVTIVTSSVHGFVAGQTVYISGIDEFYDGAYLIASVPSTTSFTYTKSGGSAPLSATLLPTVQIGSTVCDVSSKYLTDNVAGLNLNSNIGDHPINSLVRVRGVDSTFDGDYHLAAATTSSPATTAITYKINRTPLANVGSVGSPVSVTSSSAAKARVPFAIKVLTGTTTAEPSLPSGTNIKLAVVTVANGASSIVEDNIADRRQFVTTVGGVYIHNSASNSAITLPTFSEGTLKYDTADKDLKYFDGTNWKLVSNLTLSGTGSATDTAAKSDHTHTADTSYLGISQVVAADRTGTTSVVVFPTDSDTTALGANKTYQFEARILFKGNNTMSFDLQPTSAFSVGIFNFLTWSFTESSAINQSGYDTNTDGNFYISGNIGSTLANFVCEISGTIVTSSATDVTPKIFSSTGTSTMTVYRGSWIKFLEVGSDTVSVINGTWS